MPSTPDSNDAAAAAAGGGGGGGGRGKAGASDECKLNASKNRRESDWFSHDSKTSAAGAGAGATVARQPETSKKASSSTHRISNKTSRESDDWFRDDVDGSPSVRSPGVDAGGSPTDGARRKNQLYGSHQDWYKHGADVPDQPSLQSKFRNLSRRSACNEVKQKMTGADPNEWFRHDHDPNKSGTRSPSAGAAKPGKKQAKEAVSSTCLWAVYPENGEGGGDQSTPHPRSRLNNAEADEYYKRDKMGSSADWYSHDHPPIEVGEQVASPPASFRGGRGHQEGDEIASRLKGESEDWFSHEANRNYIAPLHQTKGSSPQAKDMMERAQGREIKLIFRMEENLKATWTAPPPLTAAIITPQPSAQQPAAASVAVTITSPGVTVETTTVQNEDVNQKKAIDNEFPVLINGQNSDENK